MINQRGMIGTEKQPDSTGNQCCKHDHHTEATHPTFTLATLSLAPTVELFSLPNARVNGRPRKTRQTQSTWRPALVPSHPSSNRVQCLSFSLSMICVISDQDRIYQNGVDREKGFEEAEHTTAHQAPHQRQLLHSIQARLHRLVCCHLLVCCHRRAGLSRAHCVWTRTGIHKLKRLRNKSCRFKSWIYFHIATACSAAEAEI